MGHPSQPDLGSEPSREAPPGYRGLGRQANPSATMQLVDALIEANHDIDLLMLPNHNNFSGTWGTWRENPYLTPLKGLSSLLGHHGPQ